MQHRAVRRKTYLRLSARIARVARYHARHVRRDGGIHWFLGQMTPEERAERKRQQEDFKQRYVAGPPK